MFIDNSRACIEAIERAEEKWLYAVGELLVSAIRPLIPVDTSSLKTSLDYNVDLGSKTVTIGVNENYAIYIEFGTGIYAENGGGRQTPWVYINKDGKKVLTHGSRPQPYMRPAFRSQKNNIKKLLETYLAEIGHGGARVSIRGIK